MAVLFVGAIFFNSCTKQENAAQAPDLQTQQPEMTQEDVMTFNNIMSFKTKVDYIKKNPMYKSGETMCADSAVWYLDAAVNLIYTFTFENFNRFYTDSVFIEIPFDGGEVNLDDVSAGYFELVNKIRDDIYADVQNETKNLYMSTSTVKEQNANTLIIKTVSTIGSREGDVADQKEDPFEPGDDFMYGDKRGFCIGDSAYNLDAATKLAYFTMFNRSLYIQDEGVTSNGTEWYAYYTGNVTIDLQQADVYGLLFKNGVNNYGEFMYLCEDDPSDLCLYNDYMNFYYENLHSIVYDIVPDNWSETNGLVFRSVLSEGTHNGNFEEPEKIYHLPDITYKRRWIVMDTSFPIEL